MLNVTDLDHLIEGLTRLKATLIANEKATVISEVRDKIRTFALSPEEVGLVITGGAGAARAGDAGRRAAPGRGANGGGRGSGYGRGSGSEGGGESGSGSDGGSGSVPPARWPGAPGLPGDLPRPAGPHLVERSGPAARMGVTDSHRGGRSGSVPRAPVRLTTARVRAPAGRRRRVRPPDVARLRPSASPQRILAD